MSGADAPALPTVEELEFLLLEEGDPDDDVHYICNYCWDTSKLITTFCGVPLPWDNEVPDWVEANCVECKEIFTMHAKRILPWTCPVCGNS